jgi:hypothetical protein
MTDERRIRHHGQDFGFWRICDLYRAMLEGKFDHTVEFLSLRVNHWLPIVGILEDLDRMETAEQVRNWKKKGIKTVQFLPACCGRGCSQCKAIAGKTYLIDEMPTIPPKGCTCIPWCMLSPCAVEEE